MEKTGNNHAVVDKDNVYAYRKVDSSIVKVEDNVTVTLYAAGTEAFVYQDGDKYIVAYNDGTSKNTSPHQKTLLSDMSIRS